MSFSWTEYTRGTKCKIQNGKEGILAVSLVEWIVLPGNTLYLGQKYKIHYIKNKNIKGRILSVSSVRWGLWRTHNTKYKTNARESPWLDGVYWRHKIQNTKYKTNARECPWLDGVYWRHKIQNTKYKMLNIRMQNTKQMQESVLG